MPRIRAKQVNIDADFSLNNHKLTDLAAPVSDNDAARKVDVQTAQAGIDAKDSVVASTTDVLDTCTYDNGSSGVGATLTKDSNGAFPAQDGITLVQDERLLVKNQAAKLQNGIYTLTTVGDAGTAWVLTRATDADSEISSGMYCWIEEGTTNGDRGFILTTNDPIVVGTTELDFTQFSGLGQITAGAGLTKSEDTLNVGAGTGITVNADDVAVIYGSSGISAVEAGVSAGAGSADSAARSDHIHNITTAAAGSVQIGDTGAEGSASTLARSDHTHTVAAGTPSGLADSNTEGAATTFARSDHQHARDTEKQEALTSENITGTDTALTDTLDAVPINNASVQLYLNGLLQEQGAGKDYTISSQTITWLASTGTAVDMDTSDVLLVKYIS